MPIKLNASATRLPRVTLRTIINVGESVSVDRENGAIKNVAVITSGTTRPSSTAGPFDVDAISLQQVASAINASPVGVKSRLTHPEIDGVDDLTVRMGYIRNARVVGQTVRGDMYFHAPDSTDAIRLMDIADTDPTSCGLSIVTETGVIEPLETMPTGLVLRVDELDAVDWVGDPAANPSGMLSVHRRQTEGTRITLEETKVMNEKQREFLIATGLSYDATDEQTAAFIEALGDDQKAQFAALVDAPVVEDAAAAAEEAGGTIPEATPKPKPADTPVAADADGDMDKPVTASAAASGGSGIALASQVQDAMQAERRRISEIRDIALRVGADEKWIDQQINAGTTIGEVRRIALNTLSREPSSMPTTTVTVGADLNRDTLTQAIQDGIMLKAGNRRLVEHNVDGGIRLAADGCSPVIRTPHERSSEFRGHSIIEMGRRYLVSLGYAQADRMGKPQLANLLMSRTALASALPGVYMAQSTGDFPFILADTMGKVLRAAYALAPTTWQRWCNRTTNPDFKEKKKLQLSAAADLVEIPEDDEYEFGILSESKEAYALLTYGKGVSFTRRALINDDLDAFGRVPVMLGNAAGRKTEGLAIAVLTANAAMADTIALFDAGHSNTFSGAPSVVALGAGRAVMRKQTALGSDEPLELTPRFLIVPEDLSVTASQLIGSAVDPTKSNATPNPFGPGQSDQPEVISSPRLSSDSASRWYLAADPAQIDTIDVAFLEGQEEPTIEEEDQFDTGSRRIKVTHDVVAHAIDFRGLARSSG